MRNLFKAGFMVLVAGVLAISACSSSNNPGGAGGSSGSGGATGTGGSTDGGGSDVPVGTGGSDGGGSDTTGAGGSTTTARQDHLNIINKATTGGMTVTRPAPIAYDTCKI
ncbi:MAG TPA: hypothetical protein VFH68_20910 [Polyangia bacterium]|nr:hypothetical protein [Polyangia bacterium]